MSSKIYGIYAREILDSRGNPTIETTVILENGYRGTASVPSGASLGKYEAVELRDGDPNRFNKLGVLKAVDNVNKLLGPKLKGQDCYDQGNIDRILIELDGTSDKHKIGANSILSISLACANAAASSLRQPSYIYLNFLYSKINPTKIIKIPTPTMNIINGGKHGAGNLNFQEFHIIPASGKTFHAGLQLGVEIYGSLKNILKYRNAISSVGDEGGFAPNLFKNSDALEMLTEAIKATPYNLGTDVFLGLDIAATQFYTMKGYTIKDHSSPLKSNDFISYLLDLNKNYQLLFLEDPLSEDDWEGWKEISKLIGQSVYIVGDDLIATNPTRLKKAIADKACTAVLLKPNQIGTLTEFLQVVKIAKDNLIHCIVSHRSGETNDSTIADLAVAVQADYVKFGAPARGERVAKYNRLLQIETELFPH